MGVTRLLKREVGSGPTAILETTTHVYADQADANSQPYPWEAGLGLIMYADPMRTQMRPLKSRTTNRQGNNFTWRASTLSSRGCACWRRTGAAASASSIWSCSTPIQ